MKQKSGWEYRTKYSMEDTKADMLVFGSSRAQQQYNPVFFEQRLPLSCYNVGRDGMGILYHHSILSAVLERYKPRLVMLECDAKMFIEYQADYDRLSCLLPFYNNHPEIQSTIELRSKYEKTKLRSRMYPYNSFLFKGLHGSLKTEDETIKGYLPLDGALNEPVRKVDLSADYKIDNIKVSFYKSFIKKCSLAGVHIVLTSSPYFSEISGSDKSLLLAKKIAGENDIIFIDISKGHPLLNKSSMFDDVAHVNQVGSKILSNIIIDSILSNNTVSLK